MAMLLLVIIILFFVVRLEKTERFTTLMERTRNILIGKDLSIVLEMKKNRIYYHSNTSVIIIATLLRIFCQAQNC